MGKPAIKTPTQTTAEPEPEALLPVAKTSSVPAFMADDMEEYAGAGSSSRREDNIVPFLSLLQKGSPEVNDKMPAYIKGAKPGMLMNSVTLQLYDAEFRSDVAPTGPRVIQAYSERCWVQWVPRSAGGGFVAKHAYDSGIFEKSTPTANPQNPNSKRMLNMLPDGTQVVDTAYHYVILWPELVPIVVALSSTGLQTHRVWNGIYQNNKFRNRAGVMVAKPSFSRLIRLDTFWSQNDQGDWFTVKSVDEGELVPGMENGYLMAKAFFKSAEAGLVRTADPSDQPGGDGQSRTEPGDGDTGGDGDDSPL